jgi:hypothetical protein
VFSSNVLFNFLTVLTFFQSFVGPQQCGRTNLLRFSTFIRALESWLSALTGNPIAENESLEKQTSDK